MDELRAKLASVRLLAGAVFATTLAVAGACGGDREAREQGAVAGMSQGEGGSSVSLDSALTLFRARLEPIDRLENGASSSDELIDGLVRALRRSDTATLRSMIMSRREFAYLFYPVSHFTRVPTKQEPALAWFLHLQASQKGVTRLLNRFGGERLALVDNRCSAPIRMQRNILWSECVQRIARGADTVTMRLIGGILERDGRFKIHSYANDL